MPITEGLLEKVRIPVAHPEIANCILRKDVFVVNPPANLNGESLIEILDTALSQCKGQFLNLLIDLTGEKQILLDLNDFMDLNNYIHKHSAAQVNIAMVLPKKHFSIVQLARACSDLLGTEVNFIPCTSFGEAHSYFRYSMTTH